MSRAAAALLGLLLLPWGCRNWNNPHDPRPPERPADPFPANGATRQNPVLVLRWTCSDTNPEDSLLYYDLYLSSDSPPALMVHEIDVDTFPVPWLDYSTLYHWRVAAFASGDTTFGPIWRFTTGSRADFNLPPNTPVLVTPADGDTLYENRVTLRWQGGDPDPDDTVTYEVYFGPTQTPGRVTSGLDSTAYRRSGLQIGIDYYWRVVARDNHDDTTTGPLWSFRTELAMDTTLVVLAPQRGARWRMATPQTIVWDDATLRRPGGSAVGRPGRIGQGDPRIATLADSAVVRYSTDGGAVWQWQGRVTGGQRQYLWEVPGPATAAARIQIREYSTGGVVAGFSDTFEVYDTLPPSAITVTSPAGGEEWPLGSTHEVTWTGGTFGMDSAVLYFSADNGGSWQRQVRTIKPGRVTWTVGGPVTDEARVQVRAYLLGDSATGTSEQFRVTQPQYPDSVVATVTVGSQPRAMTLNSTSGKIYVANEQSNSVSIVDASTNSLITTVAVGQRPSEMVWFAPRNRVYVTNEGGSSVSVIDGSSNLVVKTVPVSPGPRTAVLSSSQEKVYVGNFSSGTISVISTGIDSTIATIPTSGPVRHIAWSQATDRAYAACYTTGTVDVVDCRGDTLIASITVGDGPSYVLPLAGEGVVYVANQNSNSISVIDETTLTVVGTINLSGRPSALAQGLAIERVYAPLSDVNRLAVINTNSRTVIAQPDVPTLPRAALWISANVVYTAAFGAAKVFIIEGINNSVIRQLTVGEGPYAFVYDPASNKVFVANLTAGTVSILGPAP